MNGIELRIKGKVQGVGFRPFVWLLANEYGLKGDVNNDGQGVLIRFVNPEKDIAFVAPENKIKIAEVVKINLDLEITEKTESFVLGYPFGM